MVSLEVRFLSLQSSIAGFYKKEKYEHTYGLSPQQKYAITAMSHWNSRILSQIDFCLQMKAHMGTEVCAPVDAALSVLEAGFASDGVLTDGICQKAESYLLPLAEEAKAYTLLLVGHAHLDMNWMWSWDETVATVVATFKTMLKLMEEYPDFRFSQSQASTYKIIEDYAPELMPKIQKRIQEGRWEVTASAWVETDKNMPATASILNHIFYTKQYLQEHWGIDPDSLDLDFSPDTFGHSAFLPELDALGGVKYYYHCRGIDAPELILYRWQAPSGKELLMYKEPYWYNSGINPAPGIGLPRVASLCGGLKTGMAVYGVGDHGGGPTRHDLNEAIKMQAWPVFPTVKFGTLHEYFTTAEAVRHCVPIVGHELNNIFTGCYTTQSRIKRGNRRTETALVAAEGLSALASREFGVPYADRQFESAWQNVLLTHFHDILTGSCVQDSREHAMGLYQHALSVAQTRSAMALETISAAIDTSGIRIEEDSSLQFSEGAGVGFALQKGNIPTHESARGKTRIFHIFNTTGTDRIENAEITVWDWPGDTARMEVTDATGNALPFEKASDIKEYWAHRYFTLLVTVSVPAYGYNTVILNENIQNIVPAPFFYTYQFDRQHYPFEDFILENKYLRAAFDRRTGKLYSLIDKQTGSQRLRSGETGGLQYVLSQRNDMSAWVIDRYLQSKEVSDLVRLKSIGSAMDPGLETEHRLGNSRITTTVTLGNADRFLKIRLKVDWAEAAYRAEEQPLLIYNLPLANTTGTAICDVPGGIQRRREQEMDLPCLRYCAAETADGRALALVSDCKYGFRLSRGDLSVTLINTSYGPDPYPERGIHDITLFLLAADPDGAALARETDICLNPLQYVTGSIHKGSLPVTAGLLAIDGKTAVSSGIAMRKGELSIRIYEAEGIACPVTVTTHTAPKEAKLTDLFGKPLDIPVSIKGNCVSFTLAPYSSAQLEIS